MHFDYLQNYRFGLIYIYNKEIERSAAENFKCLFDPSLADFI